MPTIQIQLPAPLYREVKRIAHDRDWSIDEVLRQGAESVARTYPAIKQDEAAEWKFPPALKSKLLVDDPVKLKAAICNDQVPADEAGQH